MTEADKFFVDVLFFDRQKGANHWVPYGIPGEQPTEFDFRLNALQTAKRLNGRYKKDCRVRCGKTIHGFVEGVGMIRNATDDEEQYSLYTQEERDSWTRNAA